MDTKRLEGKRVFWSNKWDKLWLLIFPSMLLIDIFTSNKYSTFWFSTILTGATIFIVYVLYHMFNAKFAWVDTTTKQGKEVMAKAFELRYNDIGDFEYTSEGFSFIQGDTKLLILWTNIELIFAYKRDLFTVDELNIDVFTKSGQKLNLTEEVSGWHQFIVKLKETFPTIDKEFDVKLTLPAFETNLILVYDAYGRTLDDVNDSYYET